jgi:hypothetical protein
MADRQFETGGTLITDTSAVAGRWRKVIALTDSVLASGTVAQDLNGTLAGLQLKAGVELVGTFSAVQLISGSAVAYN